MSDGARILVVDDEKQIRRMLKTALTGFGYDIAEASSGQEGLNQTSIFHPDLIVLDLGLPDFDGVEVVRRLREWTQVPVVVLSVREQESDKIRALDAGADDYITKPFGMGELLARIRVALRHAAKTEDEPVLTFGECDIQDIVGVALRQIRDILQGHPLQVKMPSSPHLVKADCGLMEHVMINLLENAAKYSFPDSEISISAHYTNETLLVTVADLGPSIPKAEQEHVFNKFYRLHHSKDVSGTGLGLSICKGIVEAHGGKIWVDPSPDCGNRFTFSLPASEQPPEESAVKEGAEHNV